MAEKNIKKTNEQNLILGVTYDNEDLIRGVTYDGVEQEVRELDSYNEELIPGVYYEKDTVTESNSSVETSVKTSDRALQIVSNMPSQKGAIPIEVASSLNFDLLLLRKIIVVYDTEAGEVKEYKYLVQVFVRHLDGGITTYQDEVAGAQMKEVKWLKKTTHSLATLPKGKEQVAEFEAKVQHCIESKGVPLEIIYRNAGWRNIPGLGWRYVYDNGFIGSDNGLIHAVRNKKYSLELKESELAKASTFQLAMDMRYICRSKIASTELLLFVHAAVLSELFEQAGYPINFAFGIMGVTNSRKTSLVTTMAQLFHREKLKADAEFATATSCGIEKTLGTYRDAPVLIDDFKPGVNKTMQRCLDKKLDELLRLAGNRVPKQRMTDFMPDGDKKYFPINGGVIMTMELVTGVLSSLTRMFLTEISADEVQNDKLRYYQENRWVLPTHVHDFLCWITENFADVVTFIAKVFPNLRTNYISEIGRYSEMYATFMTVSEILGIYARRRNFWNDLAISSFITEAEMIVKGELHIMENRARRRDKADLVVEAFADAIKKGLVKPVQLNRMTSQEKYDVYEDEKHYFVRARTLRCLTNQYAFANHEHVEIVNDDELIGVLERLKVLAAYERQNGSISRSRKLPIQTGNALCYLYLKKSVLEEIGGIINR